MDEGRHIFTEEQANRFGYFTLRHLRCYAWLHDFGMKAQLHVPGRRSWLLLPKLHHLWHLCHDTVRSRINPKFVTLLTAESFIGIIGRIARSCHRSSVSTRTLERYQVLMIHKLPK